MTTEATATRPSGPLLRASLAALLAACLGACGGDTSTTASVAPSEATDAPADEGPKAGAVVKGNTLEMTTIAVEGPESDDDAAADAEAGDDVHIRGLVELAPEFAALDGTQTLFVIVKARNGPPMPRAVLRVDRPTFPLAFDIGPEQVMLMVDNPEDMLQGDLSIQARLDADGSAMAAPGDVESEPVDVTAGTSGLVLTLDRKR